MRDLFPRMERLVTDTFRAVYNLIDPKRNKNGFEIFGYDILIDEKTNVWLIEINTNPCIEESSPLLKQYLYRMIDDSLKLTLDKIYSSSFNFYQ